MNEAMFNERVDRLKKANAVVAKLDPTIRADAFKLLEAYITAGDGNDPTADAAVSQHHENPEKRPQTSVNEDALIETFESDAEHENAVLALAIYYSRSGKGPFEMADIKKVAAEKGLDIPNRPDMFFKGYKQNDKEVIRKQADGWKIMPSGESWLREHYGVSRGKRISGKADEA